MNRYPIRIVQLTTDNREPARQYGNPNPWFGTAAEALLEGFEQTGGIEVHVVSCTQRPMISSPDKLAENTWFHSLHVPKLGWLRTGYQGCIRAVRKKLRQLQPDIVHGQGTERDCAISAIFSGFPNVVTIHGNMAALARMFEAHIGSYAWLAGRLEDFTLRRAAGVFCNSAYTEKLVAPRARRTWRVPNAIRASFFTAPSQKRSAHHCVVLNVGVISARKRQLQLLDLALKLRQKGVNIELHFVGHIDRGDSICEEFLERMRVAEELGCARYLGMKSTPELISLFDSAHALIHFPAEEAFGLVVPEAMARNLQVFGTRTGGIIDIAAGAPGVQLFDVEDWNGLAEALTEWVQRGFEQPQFATDFVRERYHPIVIARRHVEIYHEVLGRAKTAA